MAVIKQGATPTSTADLLQLQDSTGAVLAKFDNTGALTAVGVAAGSGLIQGTGGLTVTGTTTINTTSTANTSINTGTNTGNVAIGNTTGTFSLTSNALNVTAAGALSGITTISAGTTGTINGLDIKPVLSVVSPANLRPAPATSTAGQHRQLPDRQRGSQLERQHHCHGANSFTTGTGTVTLGSLGAGIVQSNASGYSAAVPSIVTAPPS